MAKTPSPASPRRYQVASRRSNSPSREPFNSAFSDTLAADDEIISSRGVVDRLRDRRREVDVALNPAITIAIATLAAITSLPVLAASQGRPVPTETIIFPRVDEGSPIPSIRAPDDGEPDPDAIDPGRENSSPTVPPVVEYDVDKLPLPVKRLRE